VEILTRSPNQAAAPHFVANRVIICLEAAFGRHDSKVTSEPKASDSLQRNIAIQPAKAFSSNSPPLCKRRLPGLLRHCVEQPGLGMDEKSATAITPIRYRNDASTTITGVERADCPVVHERMPLHELKQVGFDVGPYDAVRLDDRTRF
jgi:hypothetical protein